MVATALHVSCLASNRTSHKPEDWGRVSRSVRGSVEPFWGPDVFPVPLGPARRMPRGGRAPWLSLQSVVGSMVCGSCRGKNLKHRICSDHLASQHSVRVCGVVV